MTKFVIREETRKRCKIVPVDEKSAKRYRPIAMELYSYFFDAASLDFALWVRAGEELIEFITPGPPKKSQLEAVWRATQVKGADCEVYVRVQDFPLVEELLRDVRHSKFAALTSEHPGLDRDVFSVFDDLSAASQLIVAGGVNKAVVQKAASAVNRLLQTQLSSDIALASLSRMITLDPSLYDHAAAVALTSGLIAQNCLEEEQSPEDIATVASCGLYHDIGKSCIPTHVLNKPGAFSEEDYLVMRTHADLGKQEIEKLRHAGAPLGPAVARVAGEHHERLDGSGYPDGLSGRAEEGGNGLHLYTRIVSIADVFCELLATKGYKEGYDAKAALKMMDDEGARWDRAILEPFRAAMLAGLKKLEEVNDSLKKSRVVMIDEDESFADALKER